MALTPALHQFYDYIVAYRIYQVVCLGSEMSLLLFKLRFIETTLASLAF